MNNLADICRECELTSKTRELERRLSEMAIEVVALTEENRVLKLRGGRRNENEGDTFQREKQKDGRWVYGDLVRRLVETTWQDILGEYQFAIAGRRKRKKLLILRIKGLKL